MMWSRLERAWIENVLQAPRLYLAENAEAVMVFHAISSGSYEPNSFRNFKYKGFVRVSYINHIITDSFSCRLVCLVPLVNSRNSHDFLLFNTK